MVTVTMIADRKDNSILKVVMVDLRGLAVLVYPMMIEVASETKWA